MRVSWDSMVIEAVENALAKKNRTMKRSFEVKESVADGRLRLNLIEQHDGYSQVTTMDPTIGRCATAFQWVNGSATSEQVFQTGKAETT